MIAVRCTGCKLVIKIKDELRGKRVKSPGCGKAVAVPAAGIGDHQDGRARALSPDRLGRADAIPAFVETEIEQARVGLVPDHRGHPLVGGRGDGQRLMTARLERNRERFAENTIIVTQN